MVVPRSTSAFEEPPQGHRVTVLARGLGVSNMDSLLSALWPPYELISVFNAEMTPLRRAELQAAATGRFTFPRYPSCFENNCSFLGGLIGKLPFVWEERLLNLSKQGPETVLWRSPPRLGVAPQEGGDSGGRGLGSWRVAREGGLVRRIHSWPPPLSFERRFRE